MDSHYAAKLLRMAQKDPPRLTRQRKFWKPEFFPFYLRRCDDLLWERTDEGLEFTRQAPALAERIAESKPTVTNGADLMILAHSYLGGAFRRIEDYPSAEHQFAKAGNYRKHASPKALAEYLRRYAYLCIFEHRLDAFEAINEAIAIHKQGNLVHRHQLGECLLCRGHAYQEFDQLGKCLDDLTASLNHISLTEDPKVYYCALYNNLSVVADAEGSDEEFEDAIANLKPARLALNGYRHRQFAKYGIRWLMAVIEAKLGNFGSAEVVLRQVREGFERLKLPYDFGILQIDLALIYLAQGRRQEIRQLVQQTAQLFRSLGKEANTENALDLWRQTFTQKVTQTSLKEARDRFFRRKQPIPAGIAA